MSSKRAFLVVIALLLPFLVNGGPKKKGEVRLLFTGDILLSRQVEAEIARKGESPWRNLAGLFEGADWIGGNLEGAVGPEDECTKTGSAGPCFAIKPELISMLARAGFTAAGVENNHSYDLGQKGRDATLGQLRENGITPLSFEGSPQFVRFGSLTAGIVSISMVPEKDREFPTTELKQKLRLARQLSNAVIVSVHWGSELLEWPSTSERQRAEWLVRNGADLILGHHPHVVQRAELIHGKPVFFSLGNHVFDQKYPATKEGLIADCVISEKSLSCGGIRTKTDAGTEFPMPAGTVSERLNTSLPAPLQVSGFTLKPVTTGGDGAILLEGYRGERLQWRTRISHLVSIESGIIGGREMLFTLERHYSPIDRERGLRPYVYEAGPRGLLARWRGSALAWPLVDARLLKGSDGILCALHRADSFMMLNAGTKGTRIAAYRWNGFGFTGVDDSAIVERCRACLNE